MPTMQFKLRTVSPAFVQGADARGEPEFRAASVRGQLRYWGRCVWGARSPDSQKVWKEESAIFGSTGAGSRVLLRLTPLKTRKTDKFPMLPHRGEGDRRSSPTPAIRPDTGCTLTVVTRPGQDMPDDFNTALSLFLLLGGMGKRSRRMFGGLQLRAFGAEEGVNVESWWSDPPTSPQEHAQIVNRVLGDSLSGVGPMDRVPYFPTLHPSMSWVLVGKRVFGSPEEANRVLFHDLLRNDKYRSQDRHFGYAMGGRKASPLIAQLRKLDEESYFPVLTYMRSEREERNVVEVINDFLNDATRVFDGDIAWGGAF